MSIGLVFLMSLVSVASALIVLTRVFGVRRVLRHATWVDIGFTVLVCFALAGTITGLVIGILAGLIMTGTLTIWKALMGHTDALRANVARRVQPVVAPADNWCPGGTARSL